MRKRVVLMLVCLLLACCTGATLSAFAGINTNSPVGDGLIDNGDINIANFMVQEEEEESAYSVKRGNSTYQLKDIGWRNALIVPMKGIPKEDVVAGAVITMQLDVYSFGVMWTQSAYFSPFTTSAGWGANYMAMRINSVGSHYLVDPTGNMEVSVKGGAFEKPTLGGIVNDAGFQGNVLTSQKQKGMDHATFWFEYDIANQTMTTYAGNADTNEKELYSVMKNAFTIAESAPKGYFMNFGFDNSAEFDNFKVYGTLNGKTTVYADFDFEDIAKIIPAGSAEPEDQDKLVIQIGSAGGTGSVKSYDSMIVVNNPGTDARITTLNPLKVDTGMEKTFEMTVSFRLQQMVATRKIGVAFGLNRYDTKLSAPAGGASFLYLTVDADGNVVLGADNIAEDGTATATGTAQTLAGAEVGENAANLALTIVGKSDNSVDVTIGDNTFNFPNMKLNGNIAIAQTGTGEVVYGIMPDAFGVTGYEFAENEATKVVTSTFNGNYLNESKFAVQSKVAPSEYIVKQETTAHEIAGIVAEDGKVGFYGTSTNTRLMFTEQYADFVLQFDYISEAFAKRAMPGGLTTAGQANRYSPFYILFGAESSIPELAQTYALGIIEGNATQYFWGAESLMPREGKLGDGKVVVLSNMKTVEKSDDAIPCYRSVDGKITLADYGLPNEEAASFIYSFYNKTSRVKMVVINNHMAVYAAPVAEDGTAGAYVKLYEQTVANSFGYVGFGTDAPGWAAIDNVAITPIEKSVALEMGLDAVPAVDLVPDVAVADMAEDPEPAPLAQPKLTVDTAAKKVTWAAVDGAKEYEVTVTLDKEEKIKKTVTATEIDLSSLTAAGEYTVAVVAIPADEEVHLKSRATTTYRVEGSGTTPGGDDNPGGDEPSGGCNSNLWAFGGLSAVVLLAGTAILLKKKKENR